MNYKKIFNDPVHGHIEILPICVQIIDTPQFQRLRNLKQLGSAYAVFHGAAHNRFEHSIGVCHLANTLINHLHKLQPSLLITESDITCVSIAGLCHDLGHGPFSHVFDNEFIKQARPSISWSHEIASEQMLDFLIKDNDIPISPLELLFIKDLIHGSPRSCLYPQHSRGYLFEIVANKRNSVDVDKFDYIMRDCYNVGMKSSLDARRLITFTRVIDNILCFNQKEAFNLYEVFHVRYSLFKRVYTHKVAKAVEYMITDIMLHADPVLRISESIDDMKKYLYMDDTVLNDIEKSSDPLLKEARNLLLRFRKRDLYMCADQIQLPPHLYPSIDSTKITPSLIIQHDSNHIDPLSEKDVIVDWLVLNYAMKDQNPIDSVRFFTKYDLNKHIMIPKEQISAFIPSYFKEVVVRVFVRDARLAGRVQDAFRKLLHSVNVVLSNEYDEDISNNPDNTTLENDTIEFEKESFQNENLGSASNLIQVSHLIKEATTKNIPILDPSSENPFYVQKQTTPVSAKSSRSYRVSVNNSPVKTLLEPSSALTLPKNFNELLEDSPARKRKRFDLRK